jgi:CRP-like cAMP-binding protein
LKFLELISDYTLILGDKLKHFARRPLRKIITAFLKHESLKQDSKIVRLTTTKKALAESMGVQRTSLSRELQKMEQEGLITYSADTITIINPLLLR